MFLAVDQDEIIRHAFEMPALPQSTIRLAAIVAEDEVDVKQVVQIIECDPALTLKLLKVANSVYSSSSRKIGTVKDAVVRLGAGSILGLGIGACLQSSIVDIIPGYQISGHEFWRHSVAAAITTDYLKTMADQEISSLAFTTALLHDIGKLVLAPHLTAETVDLLGRASRDGQQAFHQAESEILSLNHAEVGGIVAQHWGLPEVVVKGITYHHSPQECDDFIAAVIHLADHIAHRIASPSSVQGDHAPGVGFDELVVTDLAILGVADEHLTRITTAVQNRLELIAADNH